MTLIIRDVSSARNLGVSANLKCVSDYLPVVYRICSYMLTTHIPRGGQNTSPSTPPAELDDKRKIVGGSTQNAVRLSTSGSTYPIPPRVVLQQPSPETGYGNKRLKIGSDAYATNDEPSAAITQPMDHSKVSDVHSTVIL